ncbi:winged helix-turn-helix domain-containing protein [Candidatus Hydrogenosomobacter endosymbioticus]|uniref:OmpR/PhoB-type domain-containing protein n=1 Tax=Candidatus Hydrogenosomobacter endosymbioticus TaxID=2558174 RepID=A0ABM7V9H0_9PROT|nr:helix-turn-helix domain-containing protein [Candidatus Hydrogenosomobacter endosymbioticus]BDB96455.1 hypothetical protein HYD_5880 [Candidatus Hydrogenosomobacter endosymbioticus]
MYFINLYSDNDIFSSILIEQLRLINICFDIRVLENISEIFLRDRLKNTVAIVKCVNQNIEIISPVCSLHIARPIKIKRILKTIVQILHSRLFFVRNYVFDPNKRLFFDFIDSCEVFLTEKEAEFILFLLNSPCCKASKSDIMRGVWRYNDLCDTRTLESHVYQIKQKIERDPKNPKILMFDRGGYCLNEVIK